MLKTAQSYLKLAKLLLSWEKRRHKTDGASGATEVEAQLRQSEAYVDEALSLLEQVTKPKEATVSPANPDTTSGGKGQPEGNTGTGKTLPNDGRYTLQGDGQQVALRIDLDGSGILSGDIFTQSTGDPVFQSSFRSNPGAELSRQVTKVAVILEGPQALRGTGDLQCSESGDGTISCTLSLAEPLGNWSREQTWSWSGTFQGPEMRELGLELEMEVDTDGLPSWEYKDDTKTVESCFKEAGFAIRYVGKRDNIPHHPKGKWDEAQLHGLMRQFAQEPIDRPDWNLHLLLLQEAKMRGLLGIMFDSGKRDLNQLPRQGVAVFQKPIRERWDWQRKIIQTTVHELGHALNLAHRFELPVGRADSTSFMNYDWKYKGGNNRDQFWDDFAFKFDSDELDFLRHGPWHHIVPGGAAFHTVPYWKNEAGGYVPYIPETPSEDFGLSLHTPNSGANFQFGQPVLLSVSLKNQSSETVRIPKFMLNPKSGFLQVEVQHNSETADAETEYSASDFHPIVHRCYDTEQSDVKELAPGETLTDNLNLTFGSAGFTFAEPGRYTVRATFIWQVGVREYRTIHSQLLQIQILAPGSVEEEQEMADFFRWDVGFYLALGGSDVLPEAEQTLMDIVDRRQHRLGGALDPLTTNIMRCRAINMSRDFLLFDGQDYRVRAAQPEMAFDYLSSFSDIGEEVFDPATEMSNNDFLESLRAEMELDS